jgi:hypothetical protein
MVINLAVKCILDMLCLYLCILYRKGKNDQTRDKNYKAEII